MADPKDDKSNVETVKDIETLKRVYAELVKEFDEQFNKFKDHVNLYPQLDEEARTIMQNDLHHRVHEMADIDKNVRQLEEMLPKPEPEFETLAPTKKSLSIGRDFGLRERDR